MDFILSYSIYKRIKPRPRKGDPTEGGLGYPQVTPMIFNIFNQNLFFSQINFVMNRIKIIIYIT